MATRKYWSILTTEGKKSLAEAALTGRTVGISHMAVGDGGGGTPTPNETQVSLVNEQYRARLNRLEITDTDASLIRAELIIPSQIGGFSLREAALYSEDGVCLAVSNLPETYKPLLDEGAGRMVAVNIWLRVSNTEHVQLIADPAIMLATVREVQVAMENADGRLKKALNLDDLTDRKAARKNLELGDSAQKDVGKLAGTVAAGDDSRIVDAVQKTRKINNKPLSDDVRLTAADVGAVPDTRKVNNKPLSGDVKLTASDVDAVPVARRINNKLLSEDIALDAKDVGAYSKKESDELYVQDIRVSASITREFFNQSGFTENDSAFVTAISMVGGDRNDGALMLRYIQKKINGKWVNVAE